MLHARKLLMILPLILSGCVTTMDSSVAVKPNVQDAASFCALAKPIAWDGADTDETIAQSKEHNAVGVALNCPRFRKSAP